MARSHDMKPPITSSEIKMFSKDVRLPVHLQRAMAAEAEAAREARAKVMMVIIAIHNLWW